MVAFGLNHNHVQPGIYLSPATYVEATALRKRTCPVPYHVCTLTVVDSVLSTPWHYSNSMERFSHYVPLEWKGTGRGERFGTYSHRPHYRLNGAVLRTSFLFSNVPVAWVLFRVRVSVVHMANFPSSAPLVLYTYIHYLGRVYLVEKCVHSIDHAQARSRQ